MAPGDQLDGYTLLQPIGRGGFGEVWLCRTDAGDGFRALKFIAAARPDLLEKEFQALARYRKAAPWLQSPSLIPIEHAGRNADGLHYVMPLADGTGDEPTDPTWRPLTLSAVIETRRSAATWFSGEEIVNWMSPVLDALQALTEAGLVHRDVKPDNILLFGGRPALGDIGLLHEDNATLSRRGTPGYLTPSWYVAGHPDMYGAAATLYTLLTGNLPDRMGRSAFNTSPQGIASLSEGERARRKQLLGVVRRATDERPAERYRDFQAMKQALTGDSKQITLRKQVVAGTLVAAGVLAAAGFYAGAGLLPRAISVRVPFVQAISAVHSSAAQPADAPERWKDAIQFLPLIDVQRDTVRGTWSMQKEGLISGDTGGTCLELPYEPPEEYDFRIIFTRLRGDEGIHQTLFKAGHSFEWALGAWKTNRIGFLCLDGQNFENPAVVFKPRCIENGRRHTSTVSVRNGRVVGHLDGKLIKEWKTDYHEMTGPYSEFTLAHENRLGVGSFASPTVFHSIEVLEITGKGRIVLPTEPVSQSPNAQAGIVAPPKPADGAPGNTEPGTSGGLAPPTSDGFVLIPAGSFVMGNAFPSDGEPFELPQHEVHVSAFHMQATEVTNDQMAEALNWAAGKGMLVVTDEAVMNAEGDRQLLIGLREDHCRIDCTPEGFAVKPEKGPGHPCIDVTWYGACAYCNFRSEMEGLTPCYNLTDWGCDFGANGYRLPTEAEWEKAARGGAVGGRFPWTEETIEHIRANYFSTKTRPYDANPTTGYHPDFEKGDFAYTSPVGSFVPNGYGLVDMAGNVFEWCHDWFAADTYGAAPRRDPLGPDSGYYRIVRGGSWSKDESNCRVSLRAKSPPQAAYYGIGFRTVRK